MCVRGILKRDDTEHVDFSPSPQPHQEGKREQACLHLLVLSGLEDYESFCVFLHFDTHSVMLKKLAEVFVGSSPLYFSWKKAYWRHSARFPCKIYKFLFLAYRSENSRMGYPFVDRVSQYVVTNTFIVKVQYVYSEICRLTLLW